MRNPINTPQSLLQHYPINCSLWLYTCTISFLPFFLGLNLYRSPQPPYPPYLTGINDPLALPADEPLSTHDAPPRARAAFIPSLSSFLAPLLRCFLSPSSLVPFASPFPSPRAPFRGPSQGLFQGQCGGPTHHPTPTPTCGGVLSSLIACLRLDREQSNTKYPSWDAHALMHAGPPSVSPFM